MSNPEDNRALKVGSRTMALGRKPLVMGVLNVTPDSFSDGGEHVSLADAVRHAHAMAAAGADIVDVGGESTRPGSAGVTAQEEIDRVLPVIGALARGDEHRDPLPVPVSVDTRKATVAREALSAGASMVNDVSAALDPGMVDVLLAAGDDVPVVIMHMKGMPETMQREPRYEDVVSEVTSWLGRRAIRLREAGVSRERIVIDPGIGFGKRVEDNLDRLKSIDALRGLGYPVLIGASRKTFIGHLLDEPPERRLCGSLAAVARCYEAGAEIVRVHDVRETVQLLRVLDAIRHPDPWRETVRE